ncbi:MULTISPECIES: hypothetical protein [Mycobacterium avium complex (MAC)]|jgi:hypothetical protein|uniref:hypothetical protein n=1 Tax=Mycobacterium avium complex (MAC) TaxID=120793 RepID=UPI000A021A6D|nr:MULTISPECIES: hypothetical protein [Mycobacterium avium complex (MAC)]UCN12673.1 hypothetical protein LFT50_29725 [Mycobacterium intracellulare subsp. chimaera]
MPNYTRDGNYDIDLASSGNGWLGTFASTVHTTAADILSDGAPWGPVSITTNEPATTITGTLIAADAAALTVLADDGHTERRIPIDTVLRFRA